MPTHPSSFSFGTQLIKYRLKANLSQKQVAELLGVVPSTYNAWESDLNVFRADMLPRLAQVLNTDVMTLLPPGLQVTVHQVNSNGTDQTFDARQLYNDLVSSLKQTNRLLELNLQNALTENEQLRAELAQLKSIP